MTRSPRSRPRVPDGWWNRGRLDTYRPGLPRPSHFLLHSKVVLGTVVVAACALSIAAANAHHWLLRIDQPVSERVRDAAWLDALRPVNDLGSEVQGIALAVIIGVLLWPWCRVFALAFPGAVLAGSAINVTLKWIVDRPRPPEPVAGVALASFPSGHALHAVIMFGLLPPALYVLTRSRAVFWASTVVGAVVVVIVGIERIHLGAHWPSDVLASAMVGAVVLLVTEYIVASEDRHGHGEGCALHRERPWPVELDPLMEAAPPAAATPTLR